MGNCSFHDALDGVHFIAELQQALLDLEWPPELQEHPQAAPILAAGEDGDTLIFAGLRLRAVLHTGWPTKIEVPWGSLCPCTALIPHKPLLVIAAPIWQQRERKALIPQQTILVQSALQTSIPD